MSMIIDTDADIARAVRALSRRCAVMRGMVKQSGPIPLRRRSGGYEGLLGIIVAQQVSVAAAKAIWNKFTAIIDPLTPENFLAADEATLARTGLSRPKQRTIRAISEAVVSGALPLDSLHTHEAEPVHALLTAVKGIGPWTADIYAMFCLGHGDAFAPGDLALQEAARIAYDLDERPSPLELEAIAEAWRPHRAVAARILWAYYAVAKSREGMIGNSGAPKSKR
ncbi:MAG: DNA-3-methyladenine glycosylase family protein [Beijerinckiaceae bacterium]